jgi:uncharacterized ferritin-like protein (DUF455 family)
VHSNDTSAFSVLPTELRAQALHWLGQTEVLAKMQGVRQMAEQWRTRQLQLQPDRIYKPSQPLPGRPPRPELVPPLQVPRRSMRDALGRAVLIHALAHIEFNAVNLALDALWRFAGMPPEYYHDWLQVADEEALHFSLLQAHLQSLGHAYGDFPAHAALWDMAEKTRDDPLARMALVPRTLEARGLDATPAVRAKLAQAGDQAAAAILDIILRDEIGHVAIGNRWYAWLCARDRRDPLASYAELAERHAAPRPRPPLNLEARRAAGFTDAELQALQQQASIKS